MKLLKELENIEKDRIFDTYTRVIEDFKDYDEIEKDSILEELLKVYTNYKNIIDICTLEELEYLKNNVKKLTKQKATHSEIEHDLEEKFLILRKNDKIEIPEEILPAIKKAVKSVDKKEKHSIDALNDLLIGLMKLYGIIEVKVFIEKIKKIVDLKEEVIKVMIENNLYFKYYTYKIVYDKKRYIIFEPYHYFEEELISSLDLYKDLEYKDFEIPEILCHRNSLIDFSKQSIQNLFDKLEEHQINANQFIPDLIKYTMLDYKREDLIKELFQNKKIKPKEQQEITEALERAMNNMPSATLKGYTPNEIAKKNLQDHYDKKYQKTWKKNKEKETIQDYRALREETEEMFNDCALYIMKNHQKDLMVLNNLLIENDINLNIKEANVYNDLVLFHTKVAGKTLFSKYVEQLNVASKKYKIAWQVEENVIESLFEIKKFNPNEGTTILIDTETKKEYEMYDIAFSCGEKGMLGSYIYTTLITVNKMTFANGYAFIFIKESHQNINKELEKIMSGIKTKEKKTKIFLACYKLFKKEDVLFSARPLE